MNVPNACSKVIAILAFILVIVFAIPAMGQYSEKIRSDRPGQSNSPYTVGKKILQIQTGLHIGGYNPEEEGKGSNFSIPAFFRYGITETVELNTFWSIGWDKYKIDDYSLTSAGVNNAAFGLRFNILEEAEKIPALGFEFSYKTKLISKDFRPDHPAIKFNLITAKSLSDQAGVAINAGGEYSGFSAQMDGFYTLNFSYAIDDEWSIFFENYSNFNADYFDTFFDFGAALLLNDHLQLDAFAGLAGNEGLFEWFIEWGISYRITSWREE